MIRTRYVLPLLIGLVLVLSGAKTAAHARTITPHSPVVHTIQNNSGGNCNGTGTACYVDLDWSGNAHGAATNLYVSNYSGTYTCSTATCWFERDVVVYDGANGNQVWAGYGWCEEGTSGHCSSDIGVNPNTLYYVWGWTGPNTEYFSQVPSGDINNYVAFQLNYYTSGTGGMMVWINGPSGYTCQGTNTVHCYVSGYQETFPDIRLQAEAGGNFTGAPANTTLDTHNKYQNPNDGTWHYQFTDGSIISHGLGDNPPWSGWVANNAPSQSTTGGELYSCAIVASSNPC